MKTYQDLLKVGPDEKARMEFIQEAINDHKSSEKYEFAKLAGKYYDGENPTIANFEKLVYDTAGRPHKDMYTANHRISSSFFQEVVDQEVSYLLRNGIIFGNPKTKKKLGKDIDQRVADALEYACVDGVCFGFWNYDHLEVFSFADRDGLPGFVPFYDENDGLLKAGIRYWQMAPGKPLNATLYEIDGFTEYSKAKGAEMSVQEEKTPYIKNSERSGLGVVQRPGENYDGFPIVPLQYNKRQRSELRGHRNLVDAFDLITSGMVNNSDTGELLYWVLTNCSGMDEEDDAQFIYNLITSRVVHADGGDGAKVEAHAVEAPYEGNKVTLDMLRERLYNDFQALDVQALLSGDQTATAIVFSYAKLDLKVDKTEDNVTDFLLKIMQLAGIDDQPSYNRNKVVNKTEETQTILMGADYFDDEYITKKLLAINGDIDQFEEIKKRRDAEEANRTRLKIPALEDPDMEENKE